MQLTHLLAAGLVPASAIASSTSHPNTRRVVECDFATTADNGATCESFASSWGLSVDNLVKLNPGITCPNLDTSKTYCVIGTVTDEPPTTTSSTSSRSSSTTFKTSTTTSKTSSTTTTAPGPTNTPQMPGLADNCDGFYQVASGDQCDSIAQKHSISVAQFMSWNSEVNAECTNLWLGYYVCVHVPGATTTSQAPSEPTNPPSTGPTPQMPGIVEDCKSFHQVVSGDSCWSIYTNAGITFDQFRAWNTQVDAACSNLWLGYYVCVGV